MQVVLGVTGGIAAYKAAEIVRALQREGAEVTVVMTAHAAEFVTPLTLQTLSGRRVITSQFGSWQAADPADVEHIGLARNCDLLLVAPATAGTIGRMAAGLADDFLSTFILAVTCPVAIAPAMNTRMWEHPAVKENIGRLKARGVHVLGPDTGPLASRSEGSGVGRMANPEEIVAHALAIVRDARGAGAGDSPGARSLEGKRVLVTAGPTREMIDPVRYLSNPSTGKMGFAIAEAARDLGARVVLVSGPTHLPDPAGITMVRVASAQQMRDAVIGRADGAGASDVVVMAAAVSDFRAVAPERHKVKKDQAALQVSFERTPDILAEIGGLPGKRFLVGFAAETDDLVANARRKMKHKRLDLIVANSVAAEATDSGFGSDSNEVVVLEPEAQEQRWPVMSKKEVAHRLMDLIARRLP
jgi:phosphopantothenoylcysteine decarboxylase/phosphopantothenate--cysteine ligase